MANLSRQFFKFHFGLLQLSQGQMLLAMQLLSVQNSMTSQFSLWPYIYGTFDGKRSKCQWMNQLDIRSNILWTPNAIIYLLWEAQIIANYCQIHKEALIPLLLYFERAQHIVCSWDIYPFLTHHYKSWSHSNRRIRSTPSVCAARMWLRPTSTEQ